MNSPPKENLNDMVISKQLKNLYLNDNFNINNNSNYNNNNNKNKNNRYINNGLNEIRKKNKNQSSSNSDFKLYHQQKMPLISSNKISKIEVDLPLPPIKRLTLQRHRLLKPVYSTKDLKIETLSHDHIKAKVDDHINKENWKPRINDGKSIDNKQEDINYNDINNSNDIEENDLNNSNISEICTNTPHEDDENNINKENNDENIEKALEIQKSIPKEKIKKEEDIYDNKEDKNNNINNSSSSLQEDEIEIITEEQKEEMRIVKAYINKLDNIKVNEEHHLQTETHHEIKRDRNFLNDFILLDQVESDKNNEEAVNQHIWSVDTFINNSNEEKLSKREALTMLWNIYALLILNNEHNKPVLTFQTIEMIKGRLHQLISTKYDIKEKILNLLPNIIKYIPKEELVKLRGVIGHLYRICRSFNNDISNNLSVVLSPLILVKLNNFILFPESLVKIPDRSLTVGKTDKDILLENQVKSEVQRIKQEEAKGIGKRRLYEKIFYELNTLNIGDFILKSMIIYYRQFF
jgi:hypothetical protein